VRQAGGPQGAQLIAQGRIVTGPLPSAEELQNYENVIPGLADRIVSQFELEGNHRRYIERRSVNLQATGLAIGSILFAVWILASFVMIQTGHNVEGAVSGIVAIGALITNTVVGYRRRHN